ncbi:MAG: tRNA (adenosine(37)-N6)-threonylcarbamoyltransferase complex transferase subunit TsaD [Candidatus Omnitrophica bacterium]|nr:tRNA (adenosine(37)-N6)-threonylcarbamoyltransferase complex transferase subunit TsaD [Candidatus Omnitrophota bacterium]
MLTLGIETSCDETAVALLKDGRRILGHRLFSSIVEHERFGGVIPEVASRAHIECIFGLLDDLLTGCSVSPDMIDLIAVTRGPGLAGSLLVGIAFAKSLAFSLSRPLVGVNHLQAHLHAALLGKRFSPGVGLIVSGGHTTLVYLKTPTEFETLGRSTDDAAGEAYDKVAKILGLGYPGGPVIDRLAAKGDPARIRFPRARVKDRLDFSFSGIKTAVLYYVRDNRALLEEGKISIADICASFQAAVIDMLLEKALLALRQKRSRRLILGGGVSANQGLRRELEARKEFSDIDVIYPAKGLCTDNAVMVALAGYALYKKGIVDDMHLNAEPSLRL